MPTTADKSDPLHALTAYQWEPQPQAAAFVKKVVDDFLDKLPEAKAFADRLYRETGNRFGDLIDTIKVPRSHTEWGAIVKLGWEVDHKAGSSVQWEEGKLIFLRQPHGMFPRIVSTKDDAGLLIKVESLIDFMAANGLHARLYSSPYDRFRQLELPSSRRIANSRYMTSWGVIERNGYGGYEGVDAGDDQESTDAKLEVHEWFRLRRRDEDEHRRPWERLEYHNRLTELAAPIWDYTDDLVDQAIDRVGRDVACNLFFAAEREYWQRRNTAAQFQKARQDKLGIGWANHDHHTYRSSRRHFHRLVALWEKLGFECRERFYPGPEAGWGAQVMEQPVCGIVTFNDVDISPDELKSDFAHEPMQERDQLGTVGLWCALHGESVLQAGMHHLECTFDFEALKEQMEREGGIATMPKFTDFPHLKQAFTKGERWQVDPKRIDALLSKGLITEHQAQEFRTNGAIGSHLENLERNDGFKGFNQTGVTEIIRDTDPRKA